MIEPLVDRTLEPVKKALADANIAASDIDEIVMVGGSTRIPVVTQQIEDFFGKKTNSSVNPDEVVSLGAAVQGGVFSGEVTDVLLLDVTPLSLGIETLGGVMTRLIPRNSTIPCTKSETFSTAADNQSSVDIRVLQGERKFSCDNRVLGNFRLDGIPPAPRGMPQIEVSFDIDANGIVNASAKDKTTGKEQSITISGDGSLSEEEIDSMVNDAKSHEEADNQKFQLTESKNRLESLIYQTEKMVKENEDKISESSQEELSSLITLGHSALETENVEQLESAYTNLEGALQSAAKDMYAAQQPDSPQGEENGHPQPPDDGVIDVEAEEV